MQLVYAADTCNVKMLRHYLEINRKLGSKTTPVIMKEALNCVGPPNDKAEILKLVREHVELSEEDERTICYYLVRSFWLLCVWVCSDSVVSAV